MELDSARLTCLYKELHHPLVRVAQLYVRDRMVAEDIVADSFVRLHHAWPNLAEDTQLEAYLTTIVKNQALNYLKSVATHKRVEETLSDHQSRMIQEGIRSLSSLEPEALFASEVQQLVEEAIARMDELTREVFLKSRYSDKTYQEIARDLHISSRRVHTEIQKALKTLRLALEDYLPAWLLTLYLSQIFKNF